MGYNSIDIDLALEQLGGSDKLYKTVIKGFSDRYSDVHLTIEHHLDQGDMEEARRVSHSMKGLCGNLGAVKLREKALALETAIKNNEPNIRAYLHGFSDELSKVNEDVRMILQDKYGITQEAGGNESSIYPACDRSCENLMRALESYRYSEISAAVAALKKKDHTDSVAAGLEEVYKLIEGFEYDEALALVRKVCSNG